MTKFETEPTTSPQLLSSIENNTKLDQLLVFFTKQLETEAEETTLGVDLTSEPGFYFQGPNGRPYCQYQQSLDISFVDYQTEQLNHNQTNQSRLERAELSYLIELEKFLQTGQVGDTFVVPSPFSTIRTPGPGIPVSAVMLYQLQQRDNRRELDMQIVFLKNETLPEFGQRMEKLFGPNFVNGNVESVLAQSQVFNLVPNQILEILGVNFDLEILKIDRAVQAHFLPQIQEIAKNLSFGTWTDLDGKKWQELKIAMAQAHRFGLETYKNRLGRQGVLESAILTEITNRQNNYGRYLVCAAENMGIEDQHGVLKFECPHCKATNTRPYGRLIENCQSCGKSVRCDTDASFTPMFSTLNDN